PAGKLDSTFADGGLLATNFSDVSTLMLSQDSAGGLIAAGIDTQNQFLVAHYLKNGATDPSFADGGSAVIATLALSDVDCAQILPDGSILATVSLTSSSPAVTLIHVNGNGELDTSFGNNGIGDGSEFAPPSTFILQP